MAEINNNKCCVMSSRGFRKWVITPVSAAAVGLIAYGIMAAEGKKISKATSN